MMLKCFYKCDSTTFNNNDYYGGNHKTVVFYN